MKKRIKIRLSLSVLFSIIMPLSVVYAYQVNDIYPAVSDRAFSPSVRGLTAMFDAPGTSKNDPDLWRFHERTIHADSFLRRYHEVPIYQHPFSDTTYRIGYLVWNSTTNQWESEKIDGKIPLVGILDDRYSSAIGFSRKEFVDYWKARDSEATDPGQPGDETLSLTPVPEPSTLLLLGTCILGLACSRRQFKR